MVELRVEVVVKEEEAVEVLVEVGWTRGTNGRETVYEDRTDMGGHGRTVIWEYCVHIRRVVANESEAYGEWRRAVHGIGSESG